MSSGPIHKQPVDLSALVRNAMPAIEAALNKPQKVNVVLTNIGPTPMFLKITDSVCVNYALVFNPHAPLMPLTEQDGLPREGDEYPYPYTTHKGNSLKVARIVSTQNKDREDMIDVSVFYAYVET